MQRTVRVLRLLLPLLFVGFVVVIALSWRTRIQRVDGPTDPVTSTQRPEKPLAESRIFEDTQTIGGRVVSRIRAERFVAFESGWNALENVQLTIYRPNNLTYELVCPAAQFNSQTKEAEAKGGVRVTSSDGVEIQTAQIHFDGNRLTNDIPLQFKIDQWNGRAGALDLDVQGETLRLFKKVTAALTPATPAQAPMTLDSEDALFRRKENDVTFQQDVVLTRLADRLSAQRMLGRFTSDRKQLVAMEGTGNVHIILATSASGASNDLPGRKEITCERFHTEPAGDGRIGSIIATSDPAAARAVFEGPPRREMMATTFRVALVNDVVSEVRGVGNVVMTELNRRITTDEVTLSFDPSTRKASTALLNGNFRYRDPKTEAWAVRANYDIQGDRVVLTADTGRDPTVTTEGHTVKAKQIEFSPKEGTAKATGGVITELASKSGASSVETTTLFPSGKPVFVNSDSLTMRNATKVAVFSGNVRAWQELNTLFAAELQVQGNGQVLTARGDVRTTMYKSGLQPRVKPMVSRSDQLVARRNERRIDLTGGVKIEDEARTLTSERATLFFDTNRKLERVESEKNVALAEPAASRSGSGDKATYHINRKLIYVDGSPARATAPTGSFSGQQIVFDLARNRVQVVSPTSATQGTYKQ